MANEIRVEIGEESSLASVLNRVIPPVPKLPVDLGHVTGMTAAGIGCSSLVWSGLVSVPASCAGPRSTRLPTEVGVNNG